MRAFADAWASVIATVLGAGWAGAAAAAGGPDSAAMVDMRGRSRSAATGTADRRLWIRGNTQLTFVHAGIGWQPRGWSGGADPDGHARRPDRRRDAPIGDHECDVT